MRPASSRFLSFFAPAVEKEVRRPERIARQDPVVLGGRPQTPIFEREAQAYGASPPGGVLEVPNGLVNGQGTVYDRWGRRIPWNARSLPRGVPDMTRSWDPRTTIYARNEGAELASLLHPGQRGYFHWLFDALPRYALLEHSGLMPSRVLVDQGLGFQRETWAALQAPVEVMALGDRPRVSARRLLVPSAVSTSGVMPPWVCGWLRSRLGGAHRGGGRRLYVSRARAAAGRVANEDGLRPVLAQWGIELVFAEELSFSAQVALFSEAELVVGPHGAGLSNLVFAPVGCRVVELFAPAYINVCYWTLACQVGLRYAYLLGADVDACASHQRPDMHVEPAALASGLQKFFDSAGE